MTDLFESPRLTILRAHHHIHDLNAKINEFISNKPWSYAVEADLKAHEDVHKVKFARRLPTDLPCILFDAANNLRAVLDQAGYASAIASGRADPKRTNFPFADDLSGLDNNIIGRKVCEHLPPEITALFRGFKPYKGGNDTLWALNKLCNTKKHCALIPMQIGSAFLALGQPTNRILTPDGRTQENVTMFLAPISRRNPRWDPEKYEVELARTPMGEHVNYHANVALEVAIDGIETLSSKPAVAVLDSMVRIVDGILAATEAECRRLGFFS